MNWLSMWLGQVDRYVGKTKFSLVTLPVITAFDFITLSQTDTKKDNLQEKSCTVPTPQVTEWSVDAVCCTKLLEDN